MYKNIKRTYSKEIRIGDIAIKPDDVFIGVQLRRDRHFETITLTQELYIEATFERYKTEARECATPYGRRKETERFDKMIKAPEESCIDRIMYLKLRGALVWLVCMTRPDIQYAVSFLCTFSTSPGATHYTALLDVLGYLQALDQQMFFSLMDYTLNPDGGPGSRVVLTGQTARLWKKIINK